MLYIYINTSLGNKVGKKHPQTIWKIPREAKMEKKKKPYNLSYVTWKEGLQEKGNMIVMPRDRITIILV